MRWYTTEQHDSSAQKTTFHIPRVNFVVPMQIELFQIKISTIMASLTTDLGPGREFRSTIALFLPLTPPISVAPGLVLDV